MTIINIRGTSGSGKSTLVREVMKRMPKKQRFHVEGRKQPIGYVVDALYDAEQRSVAIIGHYETPCGGCDTIQKMDKIFDLVRQSDEAGHHVLFEGLLISADVNRTRALHDEGRELRVVGLDKVPLDVCLASVNGRRRAKNPDATDVNPKNTESKFKGVRQSMKRLVNAGVQVESCDREEALVFILKELGLS